MRDAPLLDDARPATFGKGLALVIGAGLLLKCVYLAAVLSNTVLRDYWVLDSKEYLAFASRLATGDLDREVFSSSPLYIWLVARLCFDGPNGTALLLALQQLLGLATAVCAGAIGRQLFGVVPGLIGAGLYLLYGGGALLEVKLLPATLATLLATLSLFFCLWSIDRPTTLRRGIVRGLAGGALGGAALCKPDLLLVLPLAAAGSWLFQRGSLRSNLVVSGACVLGCCAAVFPAALHNLGAGEFVPISSQGGITFFQGNNPRAEGTFSLPEGFSGNKATQQAVLAGDTLLKMWQARSHWSWTLPRMAGLLLAATLTFVPARSAVAFQASAQWYLYGNEALRRRDYQRAIGFYERALEVRRRTPNIEFNLAQAYAQTGQFTKAAQHMERVLAMTPDDNAARELFVLYSRKD